jgi:hypothetical protein
VQYCTLGEKFQQEHGDGILHVPFVCKFISDVGPLTPKMPTYRGREDLVIP